jgi:hypothetical protein
MSKRDRQGIRNASEIEQRYNFGKTFAEIMGIATDARNLLEEAKNAYAGLNHEQIFNLLTNNGEWQGMYEENGNVYFNASYIKTGELSADLLKTGIIKSSNYIESVTGAVALGMSIDLDNGIINAANFQLDAEGKIKATGGEIGGFDITEDGLTKTILASNDQVTEATTVSITPSLIQMSATVQMNGSSPETVGTALTSGALHVERTHSLGEFIGTFAWYEENGDLYSLYIDPDTLTVKAKLETIST